MGDTTLAEARSRMPLIDTIRDDALEREYREVAARREAAAAPGRTSPHVGALVVVTAVGLLLTLSAVETSRNADLQAASRAQVISRIQANDEALQQERERLQELRESNAAAEAALVDLGGNLSQAAARAERIGAQAGFTAVSGPGIRITFDNAEHADPTTEWVRDSDIAALVNALWSAGAEAIAINGQRLTGVGGIRNVGTNVEINSTAIAPPYVVTAIGNPDTLAADLLNSEGGNEFFGLAQQFGWNADPRQATEVRIPAAPAGLGRLRSAQEIDDDTEGSAPQ